MTIGNDSALLVVDLQNGFISEKNELPVPNAAVVLPIINEILPRFPIRVASQDWHPADHGSFARNNPGAKPFDVGQLGGVSQVFWPDHCVQMTRGAEFHPDFDHRLIQIVFRKGMNRLVDSYSMFSDNAARNPTGLADYLRSRGAREIYVVGLALDYCVAYTALDARRLLPDMKVAVIRDASRPVDARTGDEALQRLRDDGVRLVSASELRI